MSKLAGSRNSLDSERTFEEQSQCFMDAETVARMLKLASSRNDLDAEHAEVVAHTLSQASR